MFKMQAGSLAELVTMAVLCGIRKPHGITAETNG
jgi:hypothetical protein